MGGCLSSRKKESLNLATAVPVSVTVTEDEVKIKKKAVEEGKEVKNEVVEEENLVKKEVFVIKHRKSHEMGTPQKNVSLVVEDTNTTSHEMGTTADKVFSNNNDNNNNNNMVVRTSSCTKEEVDAILIQCGRLSRSNSSGKVGRKYSGSKRSYDLDQDQEIDHNIDDVDDDIVETDRRQHRQRHRQSGRPSPSSSSQGRRRTPSREREQRSGSRERCNGNGNGNGRRVSRSPGRRTETNSTSTDSNTNNRPGKKMVSVPATVSSKSESQTTNGVKRISVKRNVGAGVGSASPRSQSPARTNNQQQQPSLSRSSSRKAEQSPYRRNPLSEIDTNSLVYAQTTTNNNSSSRVQPRNKESVNGVNQAQMQKPNAESDSKVIIPEVANKVVKASGEEMKPQTLTRTRSARRSRDLDINSETLLNPNPSYTALLLEDIHNFHQKTTNTNIPNSFSVPPCVTKANSILEAVADLNSTTSSNISSAYKISETKDPFVESEVLVNDDLMEPSFHKYVTVRRGNSNGVEDMDGQESSGSNSFVSQQHWGYSYSSTTGSSWEPNSADSTDRWSSRDEGEMKEEGRRGFSGQRNGIGRGRIGSGKNVQRTNIVSAASS